MSERTADRIKKTVTIRFDNGTSFDAEIAEGGGDEPLLVCRGQGNDDCEFMLNGPFPECHLKLCGLHKKPNGDFIECKGTFNKPKGYVDDPED